MYVKPKHQDMHNAQTQYNNASSAYTLWKKKTDLIEKDKEQLKSFIQNTWLEEDPWKINNKVIESKLNINQAYKEADSYQKAVSLLQLLAQGTEHEQHIMNRFCK